MICEECKEEIEGVHISYRKYRPDGKLLLEKFFCQDYCIYKWIDNENE